MYNLAAERYIYRSPFTHSFLSLSAPTLSFIFYLCKMIKSYIYENEQKFNYMSGFHCIDSM